MPRTDEATKQELIDQALKSMENDERPFVRIFIKRNERSDREFVSHSGDGALMARIGLLLESREDDS
jgi:hypothetical protein